MFINQISYLWNKNYLTNNSKTQNNETVIAVSEQITLSPSDTVTTFLVFAINSLSESENLPSGTIRTPHFVLKFLKRARISIIDFPLLIFFP